MSPLRSSHARPFEKQPHSYQGQTGYFEDAIWWLGPMVKFVSDEPSIGEWTALLRVQAERLVQRVNLHLALGGSFEARQ